ncbi:apolipoprotein N-acyltransferase [Maricaulis sp.]|uniref:apolipoprotein N-acyltransferase n=1 Tax=Maricaulis sp. TaxID=1486257 RepID=UPI0026041D66|nr:apolipoprotein N-acyltransferase [Maricaulis sp.]
MLDRRLQPWTWRVRAETLTGWRSWLLLWFTGALASLAMAPFHFWLLLAPAFAILLWQVDGARRRARPLRSAFVAGFVFAMGYFMAGTFWVGFAFANRDAAFIPLIPIALPVFASMLAVFWGGAMVLYAAIAQKSEWRVLVFAASLALFEWLRGHVLSGLPWNLPGYAWAAGGPVSQTASWFGVYGLTLLTVLIAVSPAIMASRRLTSRRAMPALAGLAILFLLFAAGLARLSGPPIPDQPGVRMRIVQSAITQQEKWADGNQLMVRERYLNLTAEPGLEDVTHILWPEGALPYYMLEHGGTLSRIGETLSEGQILMAGINRRDQAEAPVTYHNALAVMSFENGIPRSRGLYDKVRLVPFGEIIPLSGLLSLIGFDDFARLQFTPGPGAAVMDVPGAPAMMPLICYEAIFPGFVSQMGDERPGWLFNLSNDAWFGDTSGPEQHLNQARYRAIEFGLPMIRTASRGFSGVIDPYGRMPERIAPSDEGAFDVNLPQALQLTSYARFGDYPFFFVVLGLFIGVLVQQSRFVRKRKHSQP